MFDDGVVVDESYVGDNRKGKREWGATGKVAVFELLKRNGQVYTVAVPNTQTATLLPIIREQVKPDSIVYTEVTMYWMWVNSGIFDSTTAHIL